MLADTHAHLYWDKFEADFEEVIDRAIKAGLTYIINIGVDIETSKIASKQAKETKWPKGFQVYSSMGIHPEEAIKYFNNPDVSIHEDISKLEKLYQSAPDQIVAIGECGLDFLFANQPWGDSPTLLPDQIRELQRKLFIAQINLAKKLNLSLLIHCRDDRSTNPLSTDAWNETLDLIGDHPTILHCYSGLAQTTKLALKKSNVIFSFAGNSTYPKNEYLREAIKLIPLERIVIETDCPFLPPQSNRGKRNEPSFIVEVAETIARIKDLSLTEVSAQTSKNALVIFKLGL